MTSPRPETAVRPDSSADEAKSPQLSPVQIAAGALAAVSSAVVASFFGVAGTLIGAALASVISTVTAAVYSTSLQKTNQSLRRARTQFTGHRAAATGSVTTGNLATDAATRALPPTDAATRALPPTAPATGPATRALPAHLDPRRAPAPRRRPRWSRVALGAAAVFLVAMGIVTGIELIGQKPVSALLSGSQESGTTTIGSLSNTASHRDRPPATPSTPATSAPATPSADTSPSAEPAAEPSATQPEESLPATPRATAPTTDSAPATTTSHSPEATRSPSGSAAPTATPNGATTPTP